MYSGVEVVEDEEVLSPDRRAAAPGSLRRREEGAKESMVIVKEQIKVAWCASASDGAGASVGEEGEWGAGRYISCD